MRRLRLVFFKETGKYYTSEDAQVDESLPVCEIVDKLRKECRSYMGMHLVILFDEHDPIGYPCMIPADQRVE